jgi:hypothetical protein
LPHWRADLTPVYEGPATVVFTGGNVPVTARLKAQPSLLPGPLLWVGTIYGDAEDDLAWRMERDGIFTLLLPNGREGQAKVLDHRAGRFAHVVQIEGSGKPPF